MTVQVSNSLSLSLLHTSGVPVPVETSVVKGWAYFREAMVFMQISTNVSLTMAVGVGVAVGVVGPLSSRSDLCEHFREFSLPVPNRIY